MCKLGQDVCSCGKRFSECEAWTKVVANLSEQVGFDIYKEPFRFPMAMFKNQRYNQSIGRIDRIMKAIFTRLLQYYPSPPPPVMNIFTGHVKEQLANNWLYFDTIGETMKVSHIVDSSKDIIRTKLLSEVRPRDVLIILLIRDIEGVAASAAKRDRSPIAEARLWVKIYSQYYRILKNSSNLKFKIVPYEEMVAKPEQIRKKIGRFLGLSVPEEPLAIDTRTFHLVAGNPMRYKGKIRIKYDDSWKKVLSEHQKEQLYTMKNVYQSVFESLKAMEQTM